LQQLLHFKAKMVKPEPGVLVHKSAEPQRIRDN
jgi:hypothetical protein